MISSKRIFSWKNLQSWPKNWPFFDCEPDDPSLKPYAKRLRQEYSAILCYHGARPINIDSYYTKGLMLSNTSELIHYAKKLFNSMSIIPPIQIKEVDLAIKKMNYSNEGLSYLALDNRHLIEDVGHYLIYGSEFIMSIAAQFKKVQRIQSLQTLKTIGTPTIYKINLPLDFLSQSDLTQLAWHIGNMSLYNERPEVINFTFTLMNNLPKEYIIDHYHPKSIVDYHDSASNYTW